MFDCDLTTLDGTVRRWSEFGGRVLLVVNVASKCGFTPQYGGLEDLHRNFAARGFSVLGFPCDQFGHQEPGDAHEIRAFCAQRYEVSFPLFAKTDVNGPAAHPLYRHLKRAAPGVLGTRAVKWNFTKFLVDRNGAVVRRIAPLTAPGTLAPEIEALLAA